jgi:hypothetical protein
VAQYFLVQYFNLSPGRDAKLRLQEFTAGRIVLQGQAIFPGVRIGLHQGAVRRFPEWLQSHQTLGQFNAVPARFQWQ